MIFTYLDKFIDNSTAKLFTKSRKLGRRIERTHRTTYEHWLVYCGRRSKDLSVKLTLWVMSYCFFCVIRSINDLYWMTPGYKAQIKYGDLVKTLNNYNETKKIDADEGIKIPDLKYTDKQALILSQYLADRNK